MTYIARISVLPLFAVGMAAAQVPAVQPDAGRILQQDSQTLPKPTEAPVLQLPGQLGFGPAPVASGGPTVRISSIELQGESPRV